MNIPFKGDSWLARPLHGWQSSYATDCRSVDPGANPGPCSNILPSLESLNKMDMPLAWAVGRGSRKCDLPSTDLEHSSNQVKLRLVAPILD